MICFEHIIVNILHKGDNRDNNKNNTQRNKRRRSNNLGKGQEGSVTGTLQNIPYLYVESCPVILPRSLCGFSQSYFDMAITSYAFRYYLCK